MSDRVTDLHFTGTSQCFPLYWYEDSVTKEDIFHYVHGYLHSPEYRSTFSEDLKLSLQRIDFVSTSEDFFVFSKAGRELAGLHLNYESAEHVKTVRVIGDTANCNARKMRIYAEERKIVYNEHITIENIPEEAFEYIVSGKSAVAWIADQYQYSVDKDSGIINDPNEYGGGKDML